MVGKIDISELNNVPEKHEFSVAKYFAAKGKDVKFLRPSQIPNMHTPDILMDGLEWEIKSPIGNSKRTIEANFRQAVKQSYYIFLILDVSKYLKSNVWHNWKKSFLCVLMSNGF